MKDAPPPDPAVTDFLNSFYYFEALVRTIGRYYRGRHGVASKSETHERLYRDVVARSFRYYGISLPDSTLDLLLSSGLKKRGAKSARNLRNGVAHTWSKDDRVEICARFTQLIGALEKAFTAIDQRTKVK